MDTITVTFTEVKINVPLHGITFNTLEQVVFDIIQRIGRKVIEKVRGDIDGILKNRRQKITLENNGMEQKHFLTRKGDRD